MHYVCAPKRLLTGLLALAFAAMIVQSAAAAPRVIPYLSHGIGVGKSQYRGALVMPAKKKHVRTGHTRVRSTGNWAMPSGCTLGYSDDYVWGYTCSGTTANGSTKVAVAAPATRTGGSFAIPSGCTLGLAEGYIWGWSC